MLFNKRIPAYYMFNKVKYYLPCLLIVSLSVLFITKEYKELPTEMPLLKPAFIGTAIFIPLSFTLIQLGDILIRLCETPGKAQQIKITLFPATYLHFFMSLFIFLS